MVGKGLIPAARREKITAMTPMADAKENERAKERPKCDTPDEYF
jgi:hypothetical protein